MNKKLIILPVILTFLSLLYSEEVGNLFYHGDIGDLKDSTIEVPEEVVAVSAKVAVDPPIVTTVIVGGTPSLFFIIDHSGSMYQNPGNDVYGKRFTTSLEFIDSIMARFPSAEVGIAVFREHLYYDPADDSRFAACPGYSFGGYLPFLQLDSSYFPMGETGYQIVSKYLESDTVPGGYVDLTYVPTNVAQNAASANINVGFAAAKHAFQSAQYANNRQYIIFLSDGEASIYNGPNTSNDDFITDVDGLPTTFTIFFTQSGNAPPNLVTMNSNIQSNGYSTNNPRSNLWAIDVDTLMNALMNNITVIITGGIMGIPTDITVNGTKISNYDTVNSMFMFDDHFPLTGVKTDFSYRIDYLVPKDSILPNGDSIIFQGDSIAEGSFDVVVDPSVTKPPIHYPHPFEIIHWDRALGFYYKNAPVASINMGMDTLEIRFTEKEIDILYGYDSVTVTITNSKGNIDSETFNLSKTDSCFTKLFKLAIDSIPTQNDGILQLFDSDTVTAVFRNPNLPLDTLVLSVPFYPTTAIYPNSCNNQKILSLNIINSSILYNLPTSWKTKLHIYNMNGRLISALVDSYKQAGEYKVNWDSKRFGAGIYFLKMRANGSSVSKRVMVIK